MRRLRIRIDGQEVALADLRDDVAPRTCDAIWAALPITGQLRHCTSSGECVFFGVDVPLSVDVVKGATGSGRVHAEHGVVHGAPLIEPENLTCYVSQGDIVLTPDKACILVYGRRCVVRAYTGELPSNAFAMVRNPTELDAFERVSRRTLWEGAMPIVLERVEDP
jgi:hypothetical protein